MIAKALLHHTVLISVKYGSTLYGTHTPASDNDHYHILLPSLDRMLLGHGSEISVEQTNSVTGVKNTSADTDATYVPLQRLAYDYIGGQTYAVEIVAAITTSQAHAVVYVAAEHERDVLCFMSELARKFSTRDLRGMTGFVKSNPMLKWARLEQEQAMVDAHRVSFGPWASREEPMAVLLTTDDAFRGLMREMTFCRVVTDTAGTTKSREWQGLDADPTDAHVVFFSKVISLEQCRVSEVLRMLDSRSTKMAKAPKLDWKSVGHSWRVAREVELYLAGALAFPLPPEDVAVILSIRGEKVPLAQCSDMVAAKLSTIEQMSAASGLPDRTQEVVARLEAWLGPWMRRFYKLH